MKEHLAERLMNKGEEQMERDEITEMNRKIARNFEQDLLDQTKDQAAVPFGLHRAFKK